MRCRVPLLTASLLLVSSSVFAQQHGLKVPPGFEVTEYADGKLANDIYCMTIDPLGRIVVAGRGYIRILIDDDGDGRADRAIEFAAEPKDGAMGLWWEADALYVTGDGGLRRFRVKDGRADGPSELIRAMKTGGEHAAHAIRRGPDGWLYVLCGNNTGIDRSFAQTPASPVKEPIAGCVLRFSPDLRKSEIVAHGFRNPYGMDFDLRGDLYTFDSDNERCVSLPWYEPTRLYRIVNGGFYGWLNPQRVSFWRMPPYFFDVVPPTRTLGRGSPTGVACYRHAQFPSHYHGGLFLCDWTFGRIHFLRYTEIPTELRHWGWPEEFLSSVGENGFAPTAIVVHPATGDVFVSTGGRGTRGAVYRIRFADGLAAATAAGMTKITSRWAKDEGFAAPSWNSLDVDMTESAEALRLAEELVFKPEADDADQLKGIRLVQRYLGDVGAVREAGTIWEGYTARKDGVKLPLAPRLAGLFGGAHSQSVDVEIARTLAMVGYNDPAFRELIIKTVRLNRFGKFFVPGSHPVDDIHFLAVFARLPGERSVECTEAVAKALLALDRKMAERKLNRDSNWPLRVRELYAGLADKDASLHEAVVGDPQFGRPDHAIFAQANGFPRRRAAEVFLDRLQHDKDFALSSAVVEILGTLPADEVVPVLRKLWGQTGQDAAILLQLARAPFYTDRAKFIDGLGSLQPATVRAVRGAAPARRRRRRQRNPRAISRAQAAARQSEGRPHRGAAALAPAQRAAMGRRKSGVARVVRKGLSQARGTADQPRRRRCGGVGKAICAARLDRGQCRQRPYGLPQGKLCELPFRKPGDRAGPQGHRRPLFACGPLHRNCAAEP